MKVLVTGSRKWRDTQAIETALLIANPTVVIHGAAQGADFLAEALCKRHQINYRGYPAKWVQFHNSAGPLRNQEMLDNEHRPDNLTTAGLVVNDSIDLVLAFPMKGSIGTYDMIRRAEKAGIKVIVDKRYL